MKLLHQHFPAIWGAVLEDDRVYCEVICDGRHLHPGTVRLILKTKGLDRVVAVTDSIMLRVCRMESIAWALMRLWSLTGMQN